MKDCGFREWPFAIVPSRERAVSLWADRSVTKKQMENVIEDWSFSKASSITLMWADLGAGKTHTLYNLEARCQTLTEMLPIYVLLPQAITKFLDLYRAIATSLNWKAVAQSLSNTENTLVGTSLSQVVSWYMSDTDRIRQNIAQRWLLAEKLRSRECEMLGVPQPLTNPDDAVVVLSLAINSLTTKYCRVILMIDEYQRVAEGSRRQLQQIGHGVHTLFNACPANFSLVLSCATGMSDDYQMVLTPELVSRLSPKRITLPYLEQDDIVTYIHDLFTHYRHDDFSGHDAFYPFTEAVVREMSQTLVDGCCGEVTARRVNQAFDELASYARHNDGSASLGVQQFRRWVKDKGKDLIDRLLT